jgi:hypothetical protein
VATLANGALPRGEHRAAWGAVDNAGRRVSAGIYFVLLEIDGHRFTDRIVLLR